MGARFLILIAFAFAGGCSQYIDRNVPEPIRPGIEPQEGGEYLLYRPSSYDRKTTWPLVVVCHSGFPDSANKQIRAWTQLAESYGFLVLAPELTATRRVSKRKPEVQSSRQRSDRRHILASVRHVRAGHNISDDRIFIYGWSGGAQVALDTGLRNPQLFRAIAIAQPKLRTSILVAALERIDHHQPVYVNYDAVSLLTRKKGLEAIQWIRSHGGFLFEDPAGPVRRDQCERVVGFMQRTIQKRPWIQIRALTTSPDDPLERRFKVRCSFEPTHFRWAFGDGNESPVAQPTHRYASQGTYDVSVTVDGPGGSENHRSLELTVP